MDPSRKKINLDLPFISIVTPVYNAETFIVRAVESALSQPETAEVILVEDASRDNSFAICQSLSKKNKNIYLYTHEGHINRGAGASRNMGIKKACFDYIAFLDADDFFLDNRFAKTKKVLGAKPDGDGVYEAIGVHFNSETEKFEWNQHKGRTSLTTIEDNIDPDKLFWHQSPIGKKGYTSLDGLTVKKSALQKIGLFDPGLRLHQDSDLFMRLAMACTLYPGQLDRPVAMRGVHSENRSIKKRSIEDAINSFRQMLNSSYQWALKKGYTEEAKQLKKTIRHSRIIKVNGSDYNDSLTNLKHFWFIIKKEPVILYDIEFYIYLFKFIARYFWQKADFFGAAKRQS